MTTGTILPSVTNWRVVIIEDSLEDRDEIRRLLFKGSDRRYEFVEAETGAAGLHAVLNTPGGPPDCVVLDYTLPDTDALKVLASLVGLDALTVCPVVVLTGNADSRLGPAVLRAGAQDFIGKSWMTAESLTRAVENAAERWAMTRELHARTAALQASEAQMRLAVEVAGLGVNRIDYGPDTVVLDPIAAGLFGLEAGVRLPRAVIHATFHPDDKDEIFRRMNQSLDPSGEGCFLMEHRVINRDGSVRWLNVKKQVAFGEVGGVRRPVTGVLAAIDVTERKRAEVAIAAAFKESSDLKAALDEHAIVATTDPQGKITSVNDKFCAISKYPREELLGQNHRLINSGHHPADFFRDLWSTIAQGHPWHGEIKNRAKDGSYYWVETTIVPFLDEEGKPRQYVAIRAEITERKEAEEKLRASQERFRAAVDAVSDIIWTNSADGKMEGEQPGWGAFTGQRREEYQGFGWSKAVHPEDAQPTIDAWNLAVAEGRTFEFEHRVRRHDGQWRVCSSRAVPMMDHKGGIGEWVGVHTDITERKAAEELLSRHREDLQRAVEQRTSELAASTVALHTAERLAALGTLAAGLGHDIANLTLPIRMRLRMLEASCTTDENRKEFTSISKALDHLTNLSVGMRLMAIDPELVEASTPATDLEAWCAETSPVLRAALPRQIRLEFQSLFGLGVNISRHRLSQAVFNLVQNAGEAMAAQLDGTVRVITEAATSATGAPVVQLLVQDDGPGMPAAVLARCFEPYFSTKGRAIATGMGLGMVRGIVESAGGTVAVRSTPGEGTTFTLTLPAAGESQPPRADAVRSAAVTVKGQRESSLALMFLGQLAFKTHLHLDSSAPDVSLWVVEKPDPSLVQAYLDNHPGGRVVVLNSGLDSKWSVGGGQGEPDGASLISRNDRMTVLSPSPTPGALRDAITHASRASAPIATGK